MTDEVTLVYETDNKTGMPALRVVGGKPFAASQLSELERELCNRYEYLARGNGGQQALAGQLFDVDVQRGDSTRQPRLVLRQVAGYSAVASPVAAMQSRVTESSRLTAAPSPC